MVIAIFLLDSANKVRQHLALLKEKEFYLESNIEKLYKVKLESLNVENIKNYNDSTFHSLSERLIDNVNTLVYYIPDNNCSQCIIQEYLKLKSLPSEMQNKIILMTSFTQIRDLKIFLEAYHFLYPIYNSSSINIPDGIKSAKSGTLFVLDPQVIPRHIFMPISFMPDITDNYYNFLKRFFMNIHSQKECARIKISNSICNLGDVFLNKTAVTKVEITNISAVPLVIVNINASCDCTVVEWNKAVVNEGEKLGISIKFLAKNMGPFSKRIVIISNALNSPHIVTLKGRVVK